MKATITIQKTVSVPIVHGDHIDGDHLGNVLTRAIYDYLEYENTSTSCDQAQLSNCLLYTSPSPRDLSTSRMPSSA